MRRRLILLIVALLSVAGCDGETPTSPSPATLAGSWSGSIKDSAWGSGTATVMLSPEGQHALRGTWSATFSNRPPLSGVASAGPVLAGGYSLALYADPSPSCDTGSTDLLSFQMFDINLTSTRLRGAAMRISCSGPGFGELDLKRQ